MNSLKDFKPGTILKQHPQLSGTADKKPAGSPAVTDAQANGQSSPIDDILSMVDAGPAPPSHPNAEPALRHSGAEGLSGIFLDPAFKNAESAWKGLQYLVKSADIKGTKTIDLKISPVSAQSLDAVLNEIKTLPQDECPNLLLIDIGFDNTIPSISLLERIVDFADTMMLPTSVWIKPEFFRMDHWNQLKKISYLDHHLDDAAYAKFRKLINLPGSAWIMAGCNGFAIRPAHDFEEAPLNGSPVWAIGTLCAKAVVVEGWPTGFTKYTQVKLDNLPLIETGGGVSATQTLLSEDRIMQLVEIGFTPVVGIRNKDTAIMPKAASLAGESPHFQMFFNRVIESIMAIREMADSNVDPSQEIQSVIEGLFTQIGHPTPIDVTVAGETDANGDLVLAISFMPPDSVIAVADPIQFSFKW